MRPVITALLFVVASIAPAAAAATAGGEGDGRCGQGQLCIVREYEPPQESGNGGVTICHHPVGDRGRAQTIVVGASAVRAHQDHGDSVGECDDYERLILFGRSGDVDDEPLATRMTRPSVKP